MEKEQDNSYHKINLNWYPGHMAKTKRQIKEDINIIDVVVEILDARIPISSQNPDIREIVKNKKRVILLNKSDLADKEENIKWVKYFKKQGIPAILTNANNGTGIKELLATIENLMKEEMEKQALKGRVGKTIRVMILGIPNVGKSSLINKITSKKSAQVGNKPGVTKQKQWIKLSNKIDLLDTPGVLWPKFGSQEVGLNLSYIGTIKDENLEITEIVYNLLKVLKENYISNLMERYKFTLEEYQKMCNEKSEENIDNVDNVSNVGNVDKIDKVENIVNANKVCNVDEIITLLELIAEKRKTIKQGNILDIDKICGIILEEFRNAKIGNITLEKCNM